MNEPGRGPKRSRKVVSQTIRLEEDVLNSLKEMARVEKVSVSHLINGAIRKLVDWDSHAKKFGFIALSSSTFTRFFDYLSEDEAKEMGQWLGNNFVKDFTLFWFHRVNLDTVLSTLKLLGSEYANAFKYEEHFDGKTYTVILKHGRSMKTSDYYGEALRTITKNVTGADPIVTTTEDQVAAVITPNNRVDLSGIDAGLQKRY
jgi:predicted DNA-binding ribbon-helix-helix protein